MILVVAMARLILRRSARTRGSTTAGSCSESAKEERSAHADHVRWPSCFRPKIGNSMTLIDPFLTGNPGLQKWVSLVMRAPPASGTWGSHVFGQAGRDLQGPRGPAGNLQRASYTSSASATMG